MISRASRASRARSSPLAPRATRAPPQLARRAPIAGHAGVRCSRAAPRARPSSTSASSISKTNFATMCDTSRAPPAQPSPHPRGGAARQCRQCIMVPLSQIRALSPEQMQHASNQRSEGFWNQAPASMGCGPYRIVNNTSTCIGPWLAIFRDTADPDQLGPRWLPISTNWIVEGSVRLCVAKGTLVPASMLRSGHPQVAGGS